MSGSVFKSVGTHLWLLRGGPLRDEVDQEINWVEFLPGGVGSRYERSRLIAGAKKFLIARVQHPRKWRRELSPGTVLGWFTKLRAIARWMANEDVWSYAELGPDEVIAFLKSRRARRSDGPPTASTLSDYLDLFEDLWEYRAFYPGPMRVDIRVFEDEIWRECETRNTVPWRATSEEFALALIQDALSWLQEHGDFFIEVAEEIYSEQRRWVAVSAHRRARLSTELFARICSREDFQRIAAKGGCSLSGQGLARAFTVTIGAAVNLLLFLVGPRVSELVRLNEGCVRRLVDPGGQEIPFIKGIAAKKGGLERQWVAADPIPDVIAWLERVYRKPRDDAGLSALFVTRTQGSTIPLPGRSLMRMSSVSPISAMRAFADAPFRADRPRAHNLHPHAARKTFAAFVVRRDKSALEALSLHFGHAYRAFTDGAYAGNIDIEQLLAEADREELGRALGELLGAPQLAGRAAGLVHAYRSANVRLRGKVVLQKTVDEMISKGVKLAPCDWGYCVYTQSTSACGGGPARPNELKRSPDVCAGCANFVVTRVHAAWWNDRVRRDEEFLRRQPESLQAKQLVAARLSRSQQLLRDLSNCQQEVPIATSS